MDAYSGDVIPEDTEVYRTSEFDTAKGMQLFWDDTSIYSQTALSLPITCVTRIGTISDSYGEVELDEDAGTDDEELVDPFDFEGRKARRALTREEWDDEDDPWSDSRYNPESLNMEDMFGFGSAVTSARRDHVFSISNPRRRQPAPPPEGFTAADPETPGTAFNFDPSDLEAA